MAPGQKQKTEPRPAPFVNLILFPQKFLAAYI
jgi:hypothetical protein